MAQLPPPPEGFTPDPLATVRSWGVDVSSGFRNARRNRRVGGVPNSEHLNANAIDLTPGKSGLTMKGVENRAREFARSWPGAKVLNEGDHVHLQLPDWGGAPGLPPPPDGFEAVPGEVRDGDTLALSSGHDARLFGADAFELRQQGRRPDNSTVPLGANARDFLASQVGPQTPVKFTGNQSYGRPVVSLGGPGSDPAASLLRLGHGLAAPDYLRGSPQFGPYMEAERLARQNLLGGHGTNAETPTQFRRKDGPWQGAEPGKWGEGEAVFGDEPLPFMGLRPEVEQGYMAIWQDMKSTPEDLLAYAQANGFELDPDNVRSQYEKRNKPNSRPSDQINYGEPPRLLTDPGDGAFGSFARGFGDPINMIDELGGVVDAVGLTPGRENVWNSDRRFGDILGNNVLQNRSILGHDDAEHPVARISGQLASGVALPIGAGARTPIALAKVGAGEGLLAGFGAGEGGIVDRAPGAALGAGIGAGGGYALGGLTREALDLYRSLRSRGVTHEESLRTARSAGEKPKLGDSRRDENAQGALGRQRDYLNLPPPPPGFAPEPFGITRQMGDRLSPAEMAKLAEGVDPRSVLPRPGNIVESLEESARANPSRFRLVDAPDEFGELDVRRLPSGDMFRSRKIRGPLDATKFLRARGGIKDEGGDLAHLGITNEPRRGLPFGGNEQFLGRLIDNDKGMTLDDAGEALWERGYFTERPTPADVLDVLHQEQLGNSRYLPEDLAEIDAFRSAQAQRFAIDEAASSGTPLADEMGESINLDDLLANTPPVEAYEEMPRLMGRVGNINLGRLEKPQDVAQLINHVAARVGGFDAAARGRITHEETRKLADEIGLKPDQLLKRRQGQALNAEQLYASRAMVQRSRETVARMARKAVGGSDDDLAGFRKAWLAHVALEEQIAGATAEAGRALSQMRMLARAQDAGGDAVRAYLKSVGGNESMQDAASAIVDLMEDPARLNHFLREGVKPRWRDKFNELWVNSLLSGPKTHIVNFVGNALTTALSFPEQAMTAAIGKVTRSADRAFFGEVGARAVGLADSSVEALRNMRKAFATGEAQDATSKIDAVHQKAIGGRAGEIIRIPTRALTAADEFWKTLLGSAELRQIAYRTAAREGRSGEAFQNRYQGLLRNPSEEMVKQSQAAARYYTFQKELGPAGRGVQQVSNNWVGGKILLPFVRTPINLLKFAGERSVFGLAMPEVRAALKAGGRTRDEALAKITLGSGLSTAAVVGAMAGRISGGGPTDPRERAALLQAGWQPYSIRVGDEWVSFQRFEPVSTLLGVAADFAEVGTWATAKEADKVALSLAQSIAKNLTSKTWLSGLSDAFDVLSDPERYGGAYAQRLAGSAVVPSALNQAAQASDPYMRDARSVVDAIKSRVPVVSESVPIRRNVWGDPVERGTSVGPDMLSPFYSTRVSKDRVSQEIARLRVPISMPQRFLRVDGRRVDLSAKQYDEFVQLSGKSAKQYLETTIGSPEWRAMTDEGRRDGVSEALKEFRASARAELLLRHPELGGSIPPPPPGFAPMPTSNGRADGP